MSTRPHWARSLHGFGAVLIALGYAGAAAQAEDGWIDVSNGRARLEWCAPPQSASAKGDDSGDLAFFQVQLQPGWKTYWRTPGEAGVPPTFDWTATASVTAATVLYPAPHRLVDQGGDSIGYKGNVIFPIHIERAHAAGAVPLVAKVSFGICKNICIPVEITLTGTCTAGAQTEAFALARRSVPRPAATRLPTDPKLVAIGGSVASAKPTLTIDVDYGVGATETDLFIEAADGLYVPLPTPAKPDASGRARYVVDLSKTIDPKELLGKVLRLTMVSTAGASEATWVAR